LKFLPDLPPRPLTLAGVAGVAPVALHVGPGQQGLEIVVVAVAARPPDGILHAAWEARRARRATPVLVVAIYGD
jgi:hypothetical protein